MLESVLPNFIFIVCRPAGKVTEIILRSVCGCIIMDASV